MSESWARLQRQSWISEMMMIYGFINREHLIKKFWISTPQASKDLQDYVKNNPREIFYNSTAKRYERIRSP